MDTINLRRNIRSNVQLSFRDNEPLVAAQNTTEGVDYITVLTTEGKIVSQTPVTLYINYQLKWIHVQNHSLFLARNTDAIDFYTESNNYLGSLSTTKGDWAANKNQLFVLSFNDNRFNLFKVFSEVSKSR